MPNMVKVLKSLRKVLSLRVHLLMDINKVKGSTICLMCTFIRDSTKMDSNMVMENRVI